MFSLFSDFSEFASPYQSAIAETLDRTFCANFSVISGFWRGKFGVAGAWPSYAKAFKSCGRDFGGGTSGSAGAGVTFRPGPPFTGGQCLTVYLVQYDFSLELSGSFSGQNNYLGPIVGAVFYPADDIPGSPNQFGRGGILAGQPPVETIITSGSSGEDLVGFSIGTVTRDDGLPDDCGDPSGDNPEFPSPADTPPFDPVNPNNPVVIVSQSVTEVVSVTLDGDTYNFDVEVGDISVLPNGNVQFDVDGIPYQMTPEMDVLSPYSVEARVPETFIPEIAFPDLVTQGQLLELRVALQCVIDDICDVESFAFDFPQCDGTITTVSGQGNGTSKILSALGTVAVTLNDNLLNTCPVPPVDVENVQPQLLATLTPSLAAQAGTPIPLDNEVEYVDIIFTAIGDTNKVYKFGTDNETQGRFGYFFQGRQVGANRFWEAPQPLWFARNRVRVSRDRDETVWIRVSSFPGFTYQVYDSGVRL